jgi:methionine aminopeptidase
MGALEMSSRSALDLSTRTVKIYSGAADAQARADLAEHALDLANPHDVTAAQVGLGNADNTADANKPISTDQAAALALKAPLASPALTGVPTAPTALAGTVSDQIATTAFAYAAANDAIANAATGDTPLADHLADHANPHQVSKAQVGLALVDNTADAAKPISAATQTALNAGSAATTTVAGNLATHSGNTANPHAVTKSQVGLAAVDNTSDAAKPVSTAQQAAINVVVASAAAAQSDIDGHQANTSNPHAVTKAQVGLPNVDNTADLAKPVSTATQAAINAAVAGVGGDTIADDLAEHLADVANPHGVTKAQVGLSNVDNTTDIAKPVSDATQAAINAAVAGVGAGTIADDLAGHVADHANPHVVTKAQVGLSAVDNTADLAKPVSSAQQLAINIPGAAAAAAQADIDGHQANTNNPHATTKAQLGLANVDNTSDINKPVSTATQAAINAAVAGVDGGTIAEDLAEHLADHANPHAVTKVQIGLPNVDNTADLAKPVSSAQQAAINLAAALGDAAQADIDGHQANIANPHMVTKAQVGLGSADNTSDLTKPVSAAQQTAINAAVALKANIASPAFTGIPIAPTAAVGTSSTQIATTAFADAIGDALTGSLAAHTGNTANPHSTTKTQIGLGSVDNTSDAAKPISTAQAAALALKAPLASPDLTGIPTGPTAAPGTSTNQLATTAFADAIGDSLRASIDGAVNTPERPGDAVALYGTVATGTPAAMPRVDPAWVATSVAGNVVRVNSATAADPQVIAPAAAFDVGPVYDLRFRVQRQTDPIDPLNDSVTLAIRWLTNTYAGMAGAAGISTIANLPLVISNGVTERTARIGGGGGGLVPPAGAVYFRPYVQLFGNNHVTDVIVLGVDACSCGIAAVTLLTATTALPADTTGLVLVTAAATMTVTLPPSPVLGQTLTIKDAAGTANTRPITIDGGAPDIEGQNTLEINMPYSWVQLAYSGSQWVQV